MTAVRGAVHVLEYNLLEYRRVWRGSLTQSFISPVLFLGAMGFGLGALVNRHSGGVAGIPYLAFLGPGLLAAACMQTAVGEMTFPVMGKTTWQRIYHSQLAAPIEVGGIVAGELLFVAVRTGLSALAGYLVLLAFQIPRSPLGALAVPAGILVGLAFGAPILAFSVSQTRDFAFSVLFRFVINPMFLFAGAFFPVSQLPRAVEVLAEVTPLYHGVSLIRGLILGRLGAADAAVHVAVLLAYLVPGAVLAAWALRRKLVG